MDNGPDQAQQELFSFRSHGLDSDTFAVLRFRGSEKLMECYEYEILLASENPEISFDDVLRHPATLSIHEHDGSVAREIHGIPVRFEQQRQMAGLTLYTITLRPKLSWLTLTHKNQIFLDKSLPEIFTELLTDAGLNENEFEFRLQGDYPKIDYICQFRETHLYFMTHWMEWAGIYFFFEQAEEGEKVVFTDTASAHSPFRTDGAIPFVEPSLMGGEHRGQSVQAFICRQHIIPGQVRVRDYNYEKPSLEVEGSQRTNDGSRGEMYIYGDHASTPEEAKANADTRAQAYRCRERIYHAESTIPGIRPGTLFALEGHYRSGFNREYLILEAHHEGSQEAFLTAALDESLGKEPQQPFYRNSFSAIESDLQFRPERETEPARFYGTLNALIDASGSGQYAELDDHGRYKVILPFDLSDNAKAKSGKASIWLRMMQPYAGTDHGMHFPLHKGTEVLLTFIDGDPNRPVIAGALPNIETPSPVNAENATMSKIVSASGNVIHMEDQEGKERILLNSPKAASWLRIGHKNDPINADPNKIINSLGDMLARPFEKAFKVTNEAAKEGWKKHIKGKCGGWGIHAETENQFSYVRANKGSVAEGDAYSMVCGNNDSKIWGATSSMVFGNSSGMLIGNSDSVFVGGNERVDIAARNEFLLGEFAKLSAALTLDISTGLKVTMQTGWENKYEGGVNKWTGIKLTAASAANKAYGAKSEQKGISSELSGNEEKVAAEKNEAILEKMEATLARQESLAEEIKSASTKVIVALEEYKTGLTKESGYAINASY